MLSSCLHRFAIPALTLAVCGIGAAWAQAPETEQPSPFAPLQGDRFRDNRDRGLSESARRFGREHQGAIILGIEPVIVHGRSLNRVKSLDAHGRVFIWIDDPQAPRSSARRAGDDGDGW